MSDQTSRRGFLKVSGLGLLAATLGSKLFSSTAQAEGAAAAAPAAAVNEKDALAQSLGYHADAKKVDVKKWPKRAGAEGQKEFCYNCQFYWAKGDPKATAEAPCQIFAGKAVKSHAWCNSWAQNPKVKG